MTTLCDVIDNCTECQRYGDDCDGDKRLYTHEEAWGMSDLISREDAVKALTEYYDYSERMCIEIKALIEDVPSADAVDCTDFIEWLVDRVLDETIWENNSVAYGEIICRKLEKLGVLEVTEEPSYYIRPSAEAVKVVRCRDCNRKYVSGNGITQYYVCDFMAQYEDDGFCHHGESEVEE